MTTRFESNEDLFLFGRKLRDALAERGRAEEAKELSEVVDSYWTTASEALGEMLMSLERVRGAVAEVLTAEYGELLDAAISQIKEAFDRANNPNR